MGSNRFNKVPDYTPRKKEKQEEPTLQFSPCLVCKKEIVQGFYGRYQSGGTCCAACENDYWHLKLTEGENHESYPVNHFNGHIFNSSR